MRTISFLLLGVFLLSLGVISSVSAQEESKPDDVNEAPRPVHCVRLTQIRSTDVLDDQNIIFYMSGKKIYRNLLPHRCPGLSRRDAFMYRTSLQQLCNVDIITVLTNIGFGFSPGASCGLGMFYPVTEDDVKAIKEDLKRASQQE